MHTQHIIDRNADLRLYPGADTQNVLQPNCQFAIGNLYGNPLKFLHFLVREHILEVSKEQYEAAVEIYQKPTLTAEDLQKYNGIIMGAKLSKEATKNKIAICLAGGVMTSQDKNNLLTLRILQKLSTDGIHIDILASDNGNAFLSADKAKLIADLSHRYYQPKLKLLSYNLANDKSSITLLMTEAVELKHLKSLAYALKLKYEVETPVKLAQLIDDVNALYAKYVIKGQSNDFFEKYPAAINLIRQQLSGQSYLNSILNEVSLPYPIFFVYGDVINEPRHIDNYHHFKLETANLGNGLGQASPGLTEDQIYKGTYNCCYSIGSYQLGQHILLEPRGNTASLLKILQSSSGSSDQTKKDIDDVMKKMGIKLNAPITDEFMVKLKKSHDKFISKAKQNIPADIKLAPNVIIKKFIKYDHQNTEDKAWVYALKKRGFLSSEQSKKMNTILDDRHDQIIKKFSTPTSEFPTPSVAVDVSEIKISSAAPKKR